MLEALLSINTCVQRVRLCYSRTEDNVTDMNLVLLMIDGILIIEITSFQIDGIIYIIQEDSLKINKNRQTRISTQGK